METTPTFQESEFEAKFPVYSKINHITWVFCFHTIVWNWINLSFEDEDLTRHWLYRCSDNSNFTHDYVDLDDRTEVTPALTSTTMEYCTMSPLTLPPTPPGTSPLYKPPKRSLSIGPVADIHAYWRKRQGSDTTKYVDSYLNNFMTTRDIRTNDQGTKLVGQADHQGNNPDGYRSWQPLIGGKNDPEIRGINMIIRKLSIPGLSPAKSVQTFLDDKHGKFSKICKINRRSAIFSVLFLVVLLLGSH